MRRIFYLATIAIVIATVTLAGFSTAAQATDSCPATGGGWTKVDPPGSGPYTVAGATDYCFKFGSVNSQGCTGGVSSSWPPPGVEKPCGLSHWAYYIPPVTATNTPVNTPTNTPTDVVDNTPTPTEVVDNTPTATEVPGCQEDCVTITPTVDPCGDHGELCTTSTGTPEPPGGLSCKALRAAYDANGHYDWLLPNNCPPPGAGSVWSLIWPYIVSLLGLAGGGIFLFRRVIK